jgi:AcrR family transcriptional regulator
MAVTALPTTARAQARAAITAEIKVTARRQLAASGAAALSLRAVARELGMVSSNVYRYFSSRDDLLTALIIDAYDAVGEAAEAASKVGDVETRWLAVATAIRAWAHASPSDYALVYGSPVPGYRAPTDTVSPAARVTLVALEILRDGYRSAEIRPGPTVTMPAPVAADLGALERIADVPIEILARGLQAWTQLFGAISFELFGHLHNVIVDYDAFFEHEMRRAARVIVGTYPTT